MKKFIVEFSYQTEGQFAVNAETEDEAVEIFRRQSFDNVIEASGAWVDPADMTVNVVWEVEDVKDD